MPYLAFSRKYRPRLFDEVSGQEHVTTTLANAIARDRVGHAYLFSGPRGVGKTTTARILAKALNCEKPHGSDPCNNCATCQEISQGVSLDVLEIDGASNRGIDEIRSLREGVKFSPAKGRYKVYMIDEVHMLTPEAFNALLKVLEEPPPHTVFIFATTQPYKMPSTVLSRCQRFDFKRISSKGIIDNLGTIVEREKLKVDDEALAIVAKCAEGSMRDAQVILDQMVSFSEGAIGAKEVRSVFGLIDEDILFGMSDLIRKKDPASALKMIDSFINDGKDIFQVASALIEHYRNLLIAKVGKDSVSLIEGSPETAARYSDFSRQMSIEEILYIIASMSGALDLMRRSNIPRIPMEAVCVKLATFSSMIPLDEMVRKLSSLESSDKEKVKTPFAAVASSVAVRPAGTRSPGADTKKASGQADQDPVNGQSDRTIPAGETPKNFGSGDINAIVGSWSSIINIIKAKKISIASFLQEGNPSRIEDKTVIVDLPEGSSLHKEILEASENKRFIEDTMRKVVGKDDLSISFIVLEKRAGSDRSSLAAGQGYGLSGERAGGAGFRRENTAILNDALEMFEGEIIDRGTNIKKKATP